jgi:uncharacterized peroxidase-related enzyme
MAYIDLDSDLHGIRGLLAFSPEIAEPLGQMAEILLRSDNNTLTKGERELIATYVSYLNDCFFCQNAHGGIAQHYLQCDLQFIDSVKTNFENTTLSSKMKALLQIAACVQKGGKQVQTMHIEKAKNLGASDKEIHDTVLISAFFCMCNRYVDGLNTSAIEDRQYYVDRGKMRAEEGYVHFDLKK